jgi:HlyD family secretion protein
VRKFFSISFLMISAFFTAARADVPASGPATQSTPQTGAVRRGSLSLDVEAQGAFDPVDAFEVRLRPKAYTGELTITAVIPNGATVKKGDVLLQIDPAPMKRTLAAANNEMLAADAALTRAETEAKIGEQADLLALHQQQESVKEAEEAVKWFEKVDGPQMLKMLDLNIEQAKNQMDDGQDELDQLQKMYKSEELTNATADIVVKRAVRQVDLSKTIYNLTKALSNKLRTANYPRAKQRVDENLESAREQFALFEAAQGQGKVLRQTGLASAVAAAETVKLKLDDLKSDAEKFTVRAPCDGIVGYGQIVNGVWSGADARSLRPGERLSGSSVLVTLYRPGRLRVALELPEAKFFAIQPGQKASIQPAAFPELKYEGMCDAVPRTGGTSGNYAMTISTGDLDARLAPGMKAQVHLDVPLVENVLLVPVGAVANSSVSVKVADKFESRHVMTGRSDGKSIEILSGVREGDEVLTQAK